tara:strand:+ start:3515 stop:4144 length:630 start_codon:yes stop_codon:yes gene_type:complete
MTKYLTAQEKAHELGITTRGLAKTRHLYKHIQKSPRKFLYFKEDLREIVRPNGVGGSVSTVGTLKPPRSHRRRNVPFGEENYHKCPSGSGNNLQRLNQLRAKLAYEGKFSDDEIRNIDRATEYQITNNNKEIVEKKQTELNIKIALENDRARREDPTRYGRMLTGHVTPVISDRTPWKELNPKEPDEYERYLKEEEHIKEQREKEWEYY